MLSALFYGRSGTGKTTISSTFPAPILVLDIGERGTDSIANVKDVDIVPIEEWSEFEELYWELESKSIKYKTVVIDALHSLQELGINEAKAQNGKNPEDQTSRRDFQTATNLLKTWLTHYRDLVDMGMNIVFLAHDRLTESDDEDEDEQINPEIGPRLMPSLSSAVCGMVNVIGHTFIREETVKPKKVGGKKTKYVHYCMRLGPHGYYTTKMRNPKEFKVPSYITDPDYDKIIAVRKGLELNSDKPKAKAKKKAKTKVTRKRSK